MRWRRGGRARVIKWLDGLSGSPIQVAASGLLVIAGILALLVWGAALGSSWLIKGRMADITLTDAVHAMVRLGSNQLAWENVWPEPIEASLAGPEWFWVVFVAELAAVALLFWPLWRIVGPNPKDPAAVYIYDPPANHPRSRTRQERVAAEVEAQQAELPQRVEIVTASQRTEMVDTATMVPTVDRLLIDSPDGERLVLGRLGSKLVASEDTRAAIVLGPARSGAANGLVAPAIRDWRGPALVVTARPDVVAASWRHRSSVGRAWLFDPTRSMSSAAGVTVKGPKVGHGWSPLTLVDEAGGPRTDPARTRRNRQWDAAGAMARAMVDAVGPAGRADGQLPGSARAEVLLSSLLLAAVIDDAPFNRVVTWADRRSVDEVTATLARGGVPEAERAWASSQEDDPTSLSSAYGLLDRVLQPYDDGAVLARTEDPEISASRLLGGGADTVYVIAPAAQERLRPLVTPMLWELLDGTLQQARRQPGGRFEPPVLVVLEETASYVPPNVLDDLAASGGGLGIQLLTLSPDLAALDRRLGADRARRVLGHHRTRVAVAGITDPATLDELSSQAEGSRLVEASDLDGVSPSERGPGVTVDAGGDWLRSLDEGEAACLHGTRSPIRMQFRGSGAGRRAEHNGAWGEPSRTWGEGSQQAESDGGRRRRWRLPSLIDADDPMSGSNRSGLPDPLDSDANDRAAARYWDSVAKSGSLPVVGGSPRRRWRWRGD